MTITYLYGDLIVAWLYPEAIRLSMQRPGGYFDLTCWMKIIGDDCLVSELSIPGTHASATSSDFTLFTSNYSVCRRQNMNITQQLNAGVRFLHLIVGISEESGQDALSLYTPEGELINYDISTLIHKLFKWLSGHSSEGIILFFSPWNPQQSPLALINAVNTLISPYGNYFISSSSTPTLTMAQLRGRILIMHTLNQKATSQTEVSAGIDLGKSYPDPTIKEIASFRTNSGIPFTVQDYAINNNSASEVNTVDIEGKSALVSMMLAETAQTGTVSPSGGSARYLPQLASTWFLNWKNLSVISSSNPPPTNKSLMIARSINPSVTSWLKEQNSSEISTDWWPRVGIVVSDFSEFTDGSMISRIVSMNGAKYMRYSNSNTIPSVS